MRYDVLRYGDIVEFYERIEATTKRLEMTDYLVSLFKKTPVDVMDKVVYLTQGTLYPDFAGIEFGMAEKLAVRAIASAAGVSTERVEEKLKEYGDIGLAAEQLMKSKKQTTLTEKELTVEYVYETLDRIARTAGAGSVDMKVRLLAGLLTDASPVEAKYILRTITGKMRLGIADMTILDALAIAFATKKDRDEIERAYNLTSDMGDIAKALCARGLEGIKQCSVHVGRPIRMMLAQRLGSAEEIIEKLGGKAVCEWKYDGERIQIHKKGKKILLFSRRLENITEQYPDVVSASQNIKAKEAIIEGEAVAVDPDTASLRPFQELMRRRRKYGIKEVAEAIPAHIYLFDALYVDGDDLTQLSLLERKDRLKEAINIANGFKLADGIITGDVKEVESYFEEAIEAGCEGLILKAAGPESIYQAGARGWLWIKLKRSYQSKMIEPIDVVVVGAFHGRGRRAGTYGALLVAVYDHEEDVFLTISKLGSGFTDEELEKLPATLAPYRIKSKHARVKSALEADEWFTPAVVMEIIGDELTLSPIHTCAYDRIREGAGIAVRFPRFTRRWRKDKAPEDATTVEEIVEMYQAQLKKIEQEA